MKRKGIMNGNNKEAIIITTGEMKLEKGIWVTRIPAKEIEKSRSSKTRKRETFLD